MATALKIPQESFRLGCGRYIQKEGAISSLDKELAILNVKKPFIIGGKTALSLTQELVTSALQSANITPFFQTYVGFCCKETCEEFMQSEEFKYSDVVIGIGGGNVMDAAKYCAMVANKPLVNIPTSSATCAAFTPLSVCYNKIGQTVGTTHFGREVNCVIADTDILCKQPVRLLVAGIYDSLAKLYELKQRLIGIKQSEMDIGLYSSYSLSHCLTEILENNLQKACEDVSSGKNTKTVSDMVFATIALTGVVSGLARGSNQTAIGHKIYDSVRALFPEPVYPFLHGEIVAIGLIAQIAYNGDDSTAFKKQMQSLHMPTTLSELGVAPTDENLMLLYNKLVQSSAMAGTNDKERQRLLEVLRTIQ